MQVKLYKCDRVFSPTEIYQNYPGVLCVIYNLVINFVTNTQEQYSSSGLRNLCHNKFCSFRSRADINQHKKLYFLVSLHCQCVRIFNNILVQSYGEERYTIYMK